jgi:pimeloyl-ACP methyl ester carboxylesterase
MEPPIVDDPVLRIAIARGDTDVAVVSFSGIEHELGQVPREEFVNTLAGNRHSHFFVVDKQRSWYNATAPAILSTLVPRLRDFRRVVTIGNSMGGFGAIYFASRLPNCRTAIAFVPQFSADPEIVPGETRWKEHRARLSAWPVRHAMVDANGEVAFHTFFGSSDTRDQAHLALFKTHATMGTSIFSLPDAAHGVAKYLRQRNLLRPVLDAAILKDTGATGIRSLLADSSTPHSAWFPPGV